MLPQEGLPAFVADPSRGRYRYVLANLWFITVTRRSVALGAKAAALTFTALQVGDRRRPPGTRRLQPQNVTPDCDPLRLSWSDCCARWKCRWAATWRESRRPHLHRAGGHPHPQGPGFLSPEPRGTLLRACCACWG